MPFEGTKAPEGPKFISDSLGDRPAPPGGQNVGRAFGTNGKTEDKSAAAIPTIPVFSRPEAGMHWSRPDHMVF